MLNVSIRPHTSAYVSICQHTSAHAREWGPHTLLDVRGHRAAVLPRPLVKSRSSRRIGCGGGGRLPPPLPSPYFSIRQHTSAYVSIRQHTSAYVSIRQHTLMHHTPSIGPLPLWTLFGEFALRQLRPERPSRLSPSEFVRSDGGDTASLHGTPAAKTSRIACSSVARTLLAYVSIRQHTSAYVSIRQHTSAKTSRIACPS